MALSLALAAPALATPSHATPPHASRAPCERIQSGPTPFDIHAREQQVASGDQRIQPLKEEEYSPEARQIAASLQAFFGAREKGVPKTFATISKHPGLYRTQMQLGLELNQHGTLPPREREMVILRTAWLVRSPYEWGEHVTYGKRQGLTSEEIERITQGSSAAGWNEHDRAVLRGVEELMGDHAVSQATWDILKKTWSEPQLLELPGLVGSYSLTAMLYNTVRFAMIPGNEGFKQR
jgi:alkylhydroperoxidase family enzyme